MHTAPPAPSSTGRGWRLQLLDAVELRDPQGRVVPLAGRMAALLLARLALAPQRAWSREALIESLWPDADLVVGRNRLRQLLSSLGAALARPGVAPLLLVDRETVRLRPGALHCDTDDPRAPGELLPAHRAEWVIDERRAREPGTVALPPAPAALPHPPTRWRGDPALLERLRASALAQRVLNVVGPGGSGKTRAALEAAQRLHADFDRVAWVPLAACRDAAAMQEQWLLSLGLPSRGDVVTTLAAALAGRRVLLVMDNLEQLAAEAGGPLARLVSQVPGLHLLLTSRCAIDFDGESVFPWPGLGHPSPRLPLEALVRHPAMALLLDRTQAVRPGFRVDAGNADALTALLRRLGGLPLAIELAAGRLRAAEPVALLRLLEDHAQAFALLQRGGARNGHDERHASLLETLRWNWSLLSPTARTLLDAVSTFGGPFEGSAAEALLGEPAALALDELVRHSLLVFEPGDLPYAMHPLLREAVQQGLSAQVRQRLNERLRAWALGWANGLPPSPPLGPLRRQLPQLTLAITSAETDGVPEQAIQLFRVLQRALSDISLPRSVRDSLWRCADRLTDQDARAVALAGIARAALRAGDGPQAEQAAAAALQALPAGGLPRATVLARAAHLRWRLHRDPDIGAWLDEALAGARDAGDLALQGSVLSVQGAMCRSRDPEAAAALQQAAIDAWAAAGDAHGVHTGRYNLALALGARAATRAQALAEIEQVIEATRAAEDWGQLAAAYNQRGELLRAERRWAEAAAAYRASLRIADEALEHMPLLYALWNLPQALIHLHDAARAALLMAHAAAAWSTSFGPLGTDDLRDLRRLRRLAAWQIGRARVASAEQKGEAMPLADVLRVALAGP
jgi:predicted ATPase/tetratricopeptide (TPR) repeat protein